MLQPTTWLDAFLAKMPLQCIQRHDGDSKEGVHLYPPEEDSQLVSRRHLCLTRHLPQLITNLELNIPKPSI
jgi:hypothetical protein